MVYYILINRGDGRSWSIVVGMVVKGGRAWPVDVIRDDGHRLVASNGIEMVVEGWWVAIARVNSLKLVDDDCGRW